ncbi:hypothetical protein TVAGG3_0368920, partial [Trichomonas vaginalis G3]
YNRTYTKFNDTTTRRKVYTKKRSQTQNIRNSTQFTLIPGTKVRVVL